MSNILQNDFSAGIVSTKLMGKYNSQIYQNSCFALENFSILPQGGVTRRPGTRLLNNPLNPQVSARGSLTGTRLVPFGLDESHNYIIELGNGTIRVWVQNCYPNPDYSQLMEIYINGTAYTTVTSALLGFSLYTYAELNDIQFTQDYEKLYIAHRSHKPLVVKYTVKTIGGVLTPQLEFSQLTPTLQSNDTDNTGLFTGDECPGVVMYYASRLWFASSNNHPYRIWASRPFETNNFQFWDVESVVDDGVTSETIEKAIKYGKFSFESELDITVNESSWEEFDSGEYLFTYTGSAWTLNGSSVTLSDYGITVNDTPSASDTILVRWYDIDEISYTSENVYREDSALLLEVGSSRNDRILWMNSINNYIVVGTTSGEWLMPGTINGLSQNAYQASAYGSIGVQAVQAGSDLIFAQSNHKIRGINSSDGFVCPDLTFYTDFPEKVKRLAWQRVPEPRLYCLTNAGSIRVLFYDKLYSLQGWAIWTFSGSVLDLCVADNSDGQGAYVAIQRADGNTSRVNLEVLEEADVNDHVEVCDAKYGLGESFHCVEFASTLITNAFDTSIKGKGSTMGNPKRVYRAVARVLNTPAITVGYSFIPGKDMDGRYDQTRAAKDEYIDDIEITIPGGYEKFISVGFRSSGRNTMTILALSMNTEVS